MVVTFRLIDDLSFLQTFIDISSFIFIVKVGSLALVTFNLKASLDFKQWR